MGRIKPQVLFLTQLYPPVHGASTVGENIKNSLTIQESFDCDFIRVSTIPKSKRKWIIFKIFNLLKLYFKTFYLLISKKYDLVYVAPCASGYEFYKDFGLSLMSKWFCKKVIYHFHNKGVSTNKHINHFIKKRFFRNVFVIQSSKNLYYDINEYIRLEKVFFVPYGIPDVETGFNKPVRKSEKVRILFFAHIMREKGVFDLIDACDILKKRGCDFKCTFVGGWYDIKPPEFYEYINAKDLKDEILFLGPKYGHLKDVVLNEADIFAFPTFYQGECFPLSIIEGMKMRLPVVSTDEGAISDIVDHEVTGFLVKKRDSLDLANRIQELITNPELRLKMGNAGRDKFVREFTLEKFEARMVNVLNSVLG